MKSGIWFKIIQSGDGGVGGVQMKQEGPSANISEAT